MRNIKYGKVKNWKGFKNLVPRGIRKKAIHYKHYRYIKWRNASDRGHKFSLTLHSRIIGRFLRRCMWELTRLDLIHWLWASVTGFQTGQVYSCEPANVLCFPMAALCCKCQNGCNDNSRRQSSLVIHAIINFF